jgi:hypothetical protein
MTSTRRLALSLLFLLAVSPATLRAQDARTLPSIAAPPSKAAPAAPSAGTTGGTTGPAAPATATTSSATTVPVRTEAVVYPDRLPVVFVDEVPLAAADGTAPKEPVRVRSKFQQVPGTGADADRMRQVVLRGTMDVAPADATAAGEERRRGKITWTSVIRPDNAKMAILPSPLTSQFSSTGGKVMKEQAVTAQGDYGAVLTAVRSLYDDKAGGIAVVQGEAGQDGRDAAATGDAAALPAGAGGLQAPGGGGGGSGGGSSPLMASGGGSGSATKFKMPDVIGATESAATAADKPPVMGETTEGCPPRVDRANETVVVQSRITTDGTPTGACEDTLERFTLQKSFAACPDKVDAASGKAMPQYRRFWVDAGGTTQYIDSECQPDETQSFEMSEDPSSCTWQTDMATMQAVQRSQQVYMNRDNARVVVTGCRATPGVAPTPIVWTNVACDLRHDFAAGVSTQQRRAVYVTNGIEVTVQACADDPAQAYPHKTVANVCDAVVDLDAGIHTPQIRKAIDLPTGTAYVSDCAPDPNQAAALSKTAEGCDAIYYHYLATEKSHAAARWYYVKGGSRQYVTECRQDDAVSYTHQVQTTAYQHDDVRKVSKPSTRIYFNGPAGEVEVSPSQVRTGAPELAYAPQGQQTVETGNSSYEGCNALRETALSNLYLRADSTTYAEAVGPGTPVGPVDVCMGTVIAHKSMETGIHLQGSEGSCWARMGNGDLEGGTYYADGKWWSNINKIEKKNMETGIVISITCAYAANATEDTADDWQGWTVMQPQYCSGGVRGTSWTQTRWVGAEAASHGQPACPF